MTLPPLIRGPDCRIALLLSPSCGEDAFVEALALARALKGARAPDGRAIEVVVGLESAREDDEAILAQCVANEVDSLKIRPLTWLSRSPRFVENVLFHPVTGLDFLTEMQVPSDGLMEFMDCDAWIIFGGDEGYVPHLRPTAIYCSDLERRYSQKILTPAEKVRLDATYLAWRYARCVFTASRSTLADLTSFGGVPSARTFLTPPLVGDEPDAAADRSGRIGYESLVDMILRP